MAIRRTRKQKEQARHGVAISWSPELKKPRSEANVKRQIKISSKKMKASRNKSENAILSVQNGNLRLIKRDIIKSLVLAGLIIGAEIVLYLALKI